MHALCRVFFLLFLTFKKKITLSGYVAGLLSRVPCGWACRTPFHPLLSGFSEPGLGGPEPGDAAAKARCPTIDRRGESVNTAGEKKKSEICFA